MVRLIEEDNVIKVIHTMIEKISYWFLSDDYNLQLTEDICEAINNISTAYNVDKVVSELKEESEGHNFVDLEAVIEIVQKGGLYK